MERAIFGGKGASHCKVYGHFMVICGKMAELIQMPFGLWVWMGPRNLKLDGGLDLPWKGAILGKWVPIVKYGDFLS